MNQDTSAACPVTSEAAPVAAGCPVSSDGYDALPQPLGPDSLTWKYFGRWTGMLQG
ncbi:MAG: oxygenase MpaB family protein, partial [Mycobacterium sp.]